MKGTWIVNMAWIVDSDGKFLFLKEKYHIRIAEIMPGTNFETVIQTPLYRSNYHRRIGWK